MQSRLPFAAPRPALGRLLAVAVLALFIMVALGVLWVWKRAETEQSWRDRINNSEAFEAPRKTPSQPASPTPP